MKIAMIPWKTGDTHTHTQRERERERERETLFHSASCFERSLWEAHKRAHTHTHSLSLSPSLSSSFCVLIFSATALTFSLIPQTPFGERERCRKNYIVES